MLTLYPCAYINSLVHGIIIDAYSAPNNSASVLLFMFRFCFRDIDTISTFTIVNVAPV